MSRFFNSITMTLILLIAIVGMTVSANSEEKMETAPLLNVSVAVSEAPGGLSLDEIKAMRAKAENAGDLAEDAKKSVLSFLDSAISFTDIENKLHQEITESKKQVQSAPERIKATETELDQSLPTPDHVATTASNMGSDQRESQLRNLEAELADATTALNRLTDQLNVLKNRPTALQTKIVEAKRRQLDISKELEPPPPPDDPPMLQKARQAALAAEQIKLKTELELYENQLANHVAITALVTAMRDLAARKVARQETLVKSWQGEVQRLREFEAKKEVVVAEAAKKLALDLPPVVQKQYDVMIELGKMLEKVTAEEAKIVEQLALKQARLTQLEEDFALAREQVKYPMQSEAIGLALREQRRTLPRMENFNRESARRQEQMGEIQALLLDLDRQRRELADLDQAVAQIIQSAPKIKDADLAMLNTELRRLLGERREIVKKLEAGAQRLFKNIQRLEFIEQQIAAKAQEEARFLDEHLLWIRSAKSFGIKDLQDLPVALKWLLNPINWWQVFRDLMSSLTRNPVRWIFAMLIPVILICLRPWVHRDLARVTRQVYSVKTDSFVLTMRAMALSLRAALGWPLLIGFAGWQMGRLTSSADFTVSVGSGLFFASQSLAGSLFFYELCRKDGLAKVHFKWPESVRRALRRQLRWFIPILVMMSFLIATVQAENNSVYTDSLGRLALITLMLGFFVWAAHALRFSGEIVSMLIRRRPDGWLVRLRFIWYPLAMGVPLALILLAGMGYYYSASALYLRLGETIALILGLIIAKDLLLRWLFIIQRRLVYEDIKRKRKAAAQKQSQEEAAAAVEGEAVVIEEPEVNLDQIYEKNQVLLRTTVFFSALVGLWLIWANVLPALNILDQVQLWSYGSEVNGVQTTFPITLADLMVAVMVAIVTVVAAKNLPGLLEIILLNRFSMDYGARHAFTTIFSYVITALGVGITFTTIGIKWANLQWLIAALSVGLGFGLQEIVANFICGLIVLFERPFRIGDTVTIADISGTVTRIQIRATTIMDWDRKELIVPNKEFITGRLVNWSLSDNIIRLKFPIGIAYGSDTELAEKLLFKAAKANPLVL